MASTGKSCVVCGADCAGKPRVKDPAGHYYCKPCYESAAKRKHEAAAAVAPPSEANDPFALHMDEIVSQLPEAPPTQGCPKCGAPMPAGAQLCVKCGFNAQSGAQIRTDAVNDRPRVPGGGAWPIVIGVISIVFGACGTALNGIGVLNVIMTMSDAPGGAQMVGRLGGTSFATLMSVWLLSAGIGIARRRESSVSTIRRWAITKIVLYSTCLSCAGIAFIAGTSAASAPAELRDMGAGIVIVSLLGLLAWFLAWPVFVLVWFARPSVQDDVKRWA